MRLTKAMLEAIVQVGGVVEAGDVETCFGQDTPENDKAFHDFLRASDWAAQQLRKRCKVSLKEPR